MRKGSLNHGEYPFPSDCRKIDDPYRSGSHLLFICKRSFSDPVRLKRASKGPSERICSDFVIYCTTETESVSKAEPKAGWKVYFWLWNRLFGKPENPRFSEQKIFSEIRFRLIIETVFRNFLWSSIETEFCSETGGIRFLLQSLKAA